ncbi:MAG: hypothetical protein ABI417_21360 [Coleofasciculaceae cyanobacterium]
MVHITNTFQRNLALLVSQFRREKPNGDLTNLQKLIKVISILGQEAEDVNWQLKTERWLSTAIGQQLDEIGILLGLPRNINESDESYRERLQFQIFINTSNGTPEDIIKALAFFTNSTHIGYFEREHAFFQLFTDGLTFPNPANNLNDGIFSLSPAGVNYAPIVASYAANIILRFSGDTIAEPLFVAPNEDDPSELHNLEVEPYNSILYVNAGGVEQTGINGAISELNYPSPWGGQICELIQKGGNFPPRRF